MLNPCLDVEGSPLASPSFPVSYEQPVALDSHTSVMEFTSQSVSNGNKVITAQWLPTPPGFSAHSVCIVVKAPHWAVSPS